MADDFILSIEAAPAQDQIKALRKNVKSLTSEFDKLKKSISGGLDTATLDEFTKGMKSSSRALDSFKTVVNSFNKVDFSSVAQKSSIAVNASKDIYKAFTSLSTASSKIAELDTENFKVSVTNMLSGVTEAMKSVNIQTAQESAKAVNVVSDSIARFTSVVNRVGKTNVESSKFYSNFSILFKNATYALQDVNISGIKSNIDSLNSVSSSLSRFFSSMSKIGTQEQGSYSFSSNFFQMYYDAFTSIQDVNVSSIKKNIDSLNTIATSLSRFSGIINKIGGQDAAKSKFSDNFFQLYYDAFTSLQEVDVSSIKKNIDALNTITVSFNKFIQTIKKIASVDTIKSDFSKNFKEIFSGISDIYKSVDIQGFNSVSEVLGNTSVSFSKFINTMKKVSGVNPQSLQKVLSGILATLYDLSLNKDTLGVLLDVSKILSSIGKNVGALNKLSNLPDAGNLRNILSGYISSVDAILKSNPKAVNTFIQLGNAMANVTSAVKNVNAAKKALNKTTKETIDNTTRLTPSVRSMITAFLGGTSIYRTIATIKEAVVAFAELESNMRKVNTIARLSAEGLSYMREEVLRISGAYGISSPELANALYEINSATIVGIDSLKVLEQSARQAVAGYTDVISSATLISKIIKSYGYEVNKAEHITNVLFKTIERGINPMEALNKDFGKILSTGRAAGVSFEESAAALATLTSRGLQTNIAITALNAAYMKLASGNKKLNAVFRELGFASSAAALQQKGLAYVMEVLSKVTGNSMEQLRYLGFDYRDVRATTILAREATTGFAENLRYIADPAQTAGATLKALGQAQMSMKQQFAELNASIKAFAASMYTGVENSKMLRDALTSLKNTFNDISKYGSSIGSIAIDLLPIVGTLFIGRLKSVNRLLRIFNIQLKLLPKQIRSISATKALQSLLSNITSASAKNAGKSIGKFLVSGIAKSLSGLTKLIGGPIGAVLLALEAGAFLKSRIEAETAYLDSVANNAASVDLIQARVTAYQKEFRALKNMTRGTAEYEKQFSKVANMRGSLESIITRSGVVSLTPLLNQINKQFQNPADENASLDESHLEQLEKVKNAWKEVEKAQISASKSEEGSFVKALSAFNEYNKAQKDLESYLNKKAARTGDKYGALITFSERFNEIRKDYSTEEAMRYLYGKANQLPDYVAKKYADFAKGIYNPELIKQFIRDYTVYVTNSDDLAVAELEKFVVSLKEDFDVDKEAILDFREKLKQDYTNMWLDSLPSAERYQELLKIRDEYLKQFNSAISEGTAQSLDRAAELLPKLNSIRNKLTEIRPTANQSERVTAIEAISSGTKEAVDFILNAMNTDYSKDTARNTKEISQYTREQMRDTKKLYDALNKLSIAT